MQSCEFVEEFMSSDLDIINKEQKMCVLLGDFNINLLGQESRAVSTFVDTLSSNGFFPTVSLPTRVANNSISLIDNMLTNIEKYTIQSGNIMSGISDHLPQCVSFDTDSKKPAKAETYYRDYRSMDEVAFVNEFKNTDWDQLLSLDNSDPDIFFECFLSKLENLIKKHIPLKKVSKKQLKSNHGLLKPSKNPSNKKTKL